VHFLDWRVLNKNRPQQPILSPVYSFFFGTFETMKISFSLPKYSHFATLVVVGLLFLTQYSYAQKQFSVQKKQGGSVKFFEGDRIHLREGATGRWVKGELEYIKQDTLIVAGFKLGLAEIDAVRVYRPFLLGNGYILMTGGVLWPGIVAINGLLANLRPLVTPGAIIGSTLMLGGGLAMTQLGKKTYRTAKGHRLLVTEFKFILPGDSLPTLLSP
jgi:hypothetical protein